jgi:membrane-associated protease RseP (regulator of RpoE activity)
MNKKLLLTSLGLGALTITLIALPGSSARMQDGDNSTVAALATTLQQRKAAPVVEASPAILSQEIDNTVIQDIEDDRNEAQGNVQVFLDSDGSWLGVETSEVTQQKAKDLKLPAERGAVVGKVLPDSPAAKAGLRQNDVVSEINGQRVEGTAQFRRMIHEIPAGRPVQLTVWRDGRSQINAARRLREGEVLVRGDFPDSGTGGRAVIVGCEAAKMLSHCRWGCFAIRAR